MVTINMISAPMNRQHYGIRLVSETEHKVTGRGVHNPSHMHTVEVWENGAWGNPDTDPRGLPFTEPYTYLMSPQSITISTMVTEPVAEGETLALGQVVELQRNGRTLGMFRIDADPLHNPHLTAV